jgi:hypothetical protein
MRSASLSRGSIAIPVRDSAPRSLPLSVGLSRQQKFRCHNCGPPGRCSAIPVYRMIDQSIIVELVTCVNSAKASWRSGEATPLANPSETQAAAFNRSRFISFNSVMLM